MDGCRRRTEARTSSETSALIGDVSGEFARQDLEVTGPMPSEWTDEKHSLYLKSMEASFVNQLYNSVDLLSWRLRKEMPDPKLSELVHCDTRAPSGQVGNFELVSNHYLFKVRRHGCWHQINFRNRRSQPNVGNESYELLTSSWIRHFRSARKPQVVASASLQESTAFRSQSINSNGENAIFCGSGACSRNAHQCRSHACRHDMIDTNTEVSDQNFNDEDIESEKASNGFCSKKMRILTTPTSSSDQVVPNGKPPVTEDVAEQCISAAS